MSIIFTASAVKPVLSRSMMFYKEAGYLNVARRTTNQLCIKEKEKPLRIKLDYMFPYPWEKEEIILKRLNTASRNSLRSQLNLSKLVVNAIIARRQYKPFLEIEDVLLSESINIKLLNRLAFAIINEDQANTPDSRSAPSTETKTAYKRKSFHKPPLPSVTAEQAKVVTGIHGEGSFISCCTLIKEESSWRIHSIDSLELGFTKKNQFDFVNKMQKFVSKIPKGLYFTMSSLNKSTITKENETRNRNSHMVNACIMNELLKRNGFYDELSSENDFLDRKLFHVRLPALLQQSMSIGLVNKVQSQDTLTSILTGKGDSSLLKVSPEVVASYTQQSAALLDYQRFCMRLSLLMAMSFTHDDVINRDPDL